MNKIWQFYKWFQLIKKIGIVISGISLLVMMVIIVYDVFIRNVFSNSFRGGFEIIQNYFMPLVVFPGLAYMYSSGVLPKMDMLIDRFNLSIQRIIVFIMLLIELFILFLIVNYSWDYAMSGVERQTAFPAAGVLYPLYPFFFLIPVAFFMIIIENIFILLRNILINEPTLVMKKEDKSPEELL